MVSFILFENGGQVFLNPLCGPLFYKPTWEEEATLLVIQMDFSLEKVWITTSAQLIKSQTMELLALL